MRVGLLRIRWGACTEMKPLAPEGSRAAAGVCVSRYGVGPHLQMIMFRECQAKRDVVRAIHHHNL
jgi:hypothetical protein